MHNRKRAATDVKRKRTHRGKNPQPPGRCLLAVEVGHLG
jgi:hypothetical protein